MRRFQDRRHIEVTGIVKQRTWNALDARWQNIQQRRRHVSAQYDRIMRIARAQKGDPYVFGAAGPGAFDCSGLTLYVYQHAAGIGMVHLAGSQYHPSHRITKRQARPGDLVFFHSGRHIYHVAIYAGRGYIIHAPHPGARVRREHIWTRSVYYERLLPSP